MQTQTRSAGTRSKDGKAHLLLLPQSKQGVSANACFKVFLVIGLFSLSPLPSIFTFKATAT